MSSLTALIPARGGSKGVPGKNIKILKGHPLLAFSIAACKMTKNIDRIIVSTDDNNIAETARIYGAEVPFMRPKEYAMDNSVDSEYLNHFFDNIDCDEVVLIRPTTPFRDPELMSQIIDHYQTNKTVCSSLRTAHKLSESPYKMLKKDGDGYWSGLFSEFNGNTQYTNLPRQAFPDVFQPNGYLDIIKKDIVKSQKWADAYGVKTLAFETDFVLEIDEQYQFDLANSSMRVKDSLLLESLTNDSY